MRSRYAAYALNNAPYLMKSTHPNSPHYQNDTLAWIASINQFYKEMDFMGLEILSEEMSPESTKGWVTFKATLFQGTHDISYTERSLFLKKDERWLYVKAEDVA